MKVQIGFGKSQRRCKQQNIKITPTKIKERIDKMVKWKASGPDGIHGYWIKMIVSIQERIRFYFQSF